LIISHKINDMDALHCNRRTITEQARGGVRHNGEPLLIRRESARFGAGVFPGAQVSNGYERQFH
jgi:hypothetical protein